MGDALPAWLTGSELFAALVIIITIVVVVRVSSWLYFRLRYRDGLPLVLQPPPDPDEADLVAELAAYIGADLSGALAPGALTRATPPTPTEEQLASPTGFVAAIAALAVARRPGLHVQLTRIDRADDDDPEWRMTVTIIKQPSGRILASQTIEAPRSDIVAHIGSFCVHQVHGQLAFGRETPRWERWHSADGYRLYREGLALRTEGLQIQADSFGLQAEAHQLRRENDRERLETTTGRRRTETGNRRAADLDEAVAAARLRWTDLLEQAADRFRSASVADPANLLPLLARAALTEILGDRQTSRRLYEIARSLWPEQIESTYRLLTYDLSRGPAPSPFDPAPLTNRQAAADVTRMLRLWRITALWARTWLPRWWAPGERRYWASWRRPSHPRTPRLTLRSKRKDLRTAARVALLNVELRRLLGEFDAVDERRVRVRRLFEQIDRQLSRGKWRWRLRRRTSVDRLLTARRRITNFTMTRQRPSRIATRGWLAQYNAAAFYSTALLVPPALRPPLRPPAPGTWTDDGWRRGCVLAAVSHLAHVLRDPYNQLDPAWLRNDPDLEPLAKALMDIGIDGPPFASWAIYAGLVGRLPGPENPLPVRVDGPDASVTGTGGAFGELLRRMRRRRRGR
ncbi:hypothetical protein [Hamadaea tsunoensis]|uniref:hypothetical protein n=1 Tax=Hamadaea tsunoensis TaxID=53368 RepID=UPI0004190482|nr:hypothetical protein [Hamadaea tsunoensis]